MTHAEIPAEPGWSVEFGLPNWFSWKGHAPDRDAAVAAAQRDFDRVVTILSAGLDSRIEVPANVGPFDPFDPDDEEDPMVQCLENHTGRFQIHKPLMDAAAWWATSRTRVVGYQQALGAGHALLRLIALRDGPKGRPWLQVGGRGHDPHYLLMACTGDRSRGMLPIASGPHRAALLAVTLAAALGDEVRRATIQLNFPESASARAATAVEMRKSAPDDARAVAALMEALGLRDDAAALLVAEGA